MRRKTAVFCLCILLSAFFFTAQPSHPNGARGKKVIYHGEVKVDRGVYEFTSEIEEVIFLLTSVGGKYRVFRVRIQNWSEKRLDLEQEEDKVLIHVKPDEKPIAGILDIPRHDPVIQRKIPKYLRDRLLYPQKVEDGEEENVFVFVPSNELVQLPTHITYKTKVGSVELKEKTIAKR